MTTTLEDVRLSAEQELINRLNYIQSEWMALDAFAPEKEKKRVFALMREMPVAYLSVSENGKRGQAIDQNQPLCAPMAPADCWRYWGHRLHRSVAWQNGRWIALPKFNS